MNLEPLFKALLKIWGGVVRTAQRLADALGLLLPALFTDEDDLAEMIIFYAKLSKVQRQLCLLTLKGISRREKPDQEKCD
ncbi:hypothetical protein LL973_06605 [Xanthomonas campestris pv. nigromaculans]|nr:hypothetical protein [Xanthomonas campestris pv. nigromaculans]